MKYFMILFLFSSCGKQIVPDKVSVEHTVNIKSVEPYITAYCETLYSDPQQVTECTKSEIGKLISKVGTI